MQTERQRTCSSQGEHRKFQIILFGEKEFVRIPTLSNMGYSALKRVQANC